MTQSSEPVPLRAIYTLDVGPGPSFTALRGQEALVELMRHGYAPRFLPSAGATPAHFARCARVARAVPVFRLTRPDDLSALDEIAAAIEAHVASLVGEDG